MTLNTANPDPDLIEVLSAFLDGEVVDPKRLAEALSAPGAREALRDFALIRAEVLADESRPGDAFYQTMGPLLATPSAPDATGARPSSRGEHAALPPHQRWWAVAVPVPAAALAALAVLFVALGLWAWRPLGGRGEPGADMPPVPDRVVEWQPGVDWTPEPISQGGSPVR
jgi:hypothetical protein